MFVSMAVMKIQLNSCLMFLLREVLFGLDLQVLNGTVTACTMGIPKSG